MLVALLLSSLIFEKTVPAKGQPERLFQGLPAWLPSEKIQIN